MIDEPDVAEDEIRAAQADLLLNAGDERASPDEYPRLRNISAGFFCRAVVRAEVPEWPKYVTVSMRTGRRDERVALDLAVGQWNMLWEAAQFRRRFFGEECLPPDLNRVADRGDVNVVFVPRTRSRYYEYAPLFHLLPRARLERFGLPLLNGGQWPYLMEWASIDHCLPLDFHARLARAWAPEIQ